MRPLKNAVAESVGSAIKQTKFKLHHLLSVTHFCLSYLILKIGTITSPSIAPDVLLIPLPPRPLAERRF